jgi:para-nitrobenzyl esterase
MFVVKTTRPRFRFVPRAASAVAVLMACGTGCGSDARDAPAGKEDAASRAPAGDAGAKAGANDGGAVDLQVTLDDGVVAGDMTGKARRFLKIPFAKPPIGELRWKAPRPNDPWKGVRHETEFVAGCPQLADQGAPASDNEDCLYLNVWSPEPAPAHAPVMVWIHGGGNFSGSAGIPIPATTDTLWYDGQFFASRHGVVLVSINYRLGPFGFFAHPALAAEGEPAGNQGLLDQRLSLKWVQQNIEKFGGDPGNVTIFGESAGSGDVCYHVASPGSRGLFHRAIGESGGCTMATFGAEQTLTVVGTQMVAYGKAVGCPDGSDQLACLRKSTIGDLLANAQQPSPGAGAIQKSDWSFGVVLDGPDGVLPDTPRALFDSGNIAKVPYLLGSNNDEGTTFVFRAAPLLTEADYMADLTARFGTAAADVAAMYPSSDFGGDVNAARARVVGDSGVVCSTHDTARRAAKAGLKVNMYNFNVHWSLLPDTLLAGHASEISHVFGAPWLPTPDPDSEKVALAMNAYWSQFAATGDPNGPGAPAVWPEFTTGSDQRLQLDPHFEALKDFRTKECAFWRKYYGAE